MVKCSLGMCKNRKNSGSFGFSKDSKRKTIWKEAVTRKKFKASETSILCPSHFKPSDFLRKVSV